MPFLAFKCHILAFKTLQFNFYEMNPWSTGSHQIEQVIFWFSNKRVTLLHRSIKHSREKHKSGCGYMYGQSSIWKHCVRMLGHFSVTINYDVWVKYWKVNYYLILNEICFTLFT